MESGLGPAAFNMALDEALLENCARLQRPVLRFYGWTEPAASFGYFQKYVEVERLTALRPLVRRPTAGGIVPHDADWTYSLAFPPLHEWFSLTARESYHRVHSWLQHSFSELRVQTELAAVQVKTAPGQCFVGHEQADLLWKGSKIAGAAQRRRRDGLLIQGSVQPPAGMQERQTWQAAMLQAAQVLFNVAWEEAPADPLLENRANELARSKYSQADHNQRR